MRGYRTTCLFPADSEAAPHTQPCSLLEVARACPDMQADPARDLRTQRNVCVCVGRRRPGREVLDGAKVALCNCWTSCRYPRGKASDGLQCRQCRVTGL